MAQTVVGLFDRFDEAQAVVSDLESAGFTRDSISVVGNDSSGEYAKQYGGHDKMDKTSAEQAGSGAVGGTAVGAGLGVLAGLAALAIPGVGPIIAAGPLAGALGAGAATVAGATALGAGIGAASGALVGPLVDAGIPRPEAEAYNEGVRRGGTLVTVRTNDRQDAEEAADIMSRHNVIDIDDRSEQYRSGGWKYDDNAEPYTADEINSFRTGSYNTTARTTDFDTTRTSNVNSSRTLDNNDEAVLPVVEEELQIGKRQVERGGVRVRTYVTEKPIEESIRLREERVNIERRPVNREVNPADVGAFQEQTIEVRETAEEAVVAKRARLVEEVVIHKDAQERTETVRDTVRRQDVDIDENAAATGATSERMVGGADFSSYDSDFRNHFQTNYSTSGMDYDAYGPVYRYGYNLAGSDQYRNSDWNTIEGDVRTRWEERNPGTWDQFKDGIRYAWDRARGKR